MTKKQPIDLRATVQARLDQLTFVKALRLSDVPDDERSALHEGTSSDFTQGVCLNDAVAIFLDWWGWGMSNRYSFAVFKQVDGDWEHVESRIGDVNEAIATAIQALTEHALASTTKRRRA